LRRRYSGSGGWVTAVSATNELTELLHLFGVGRKPFDQRETNDMRFLLMPGCVEVIRDSDDIFSLKNPGSDKMPHERNRNGIGRHGANSTDSRRQCKRSARLSPRVGTFRFRPKAPLAILRTILAFEPCLAGVARNAAFLIRAQRHFVLALKAFSFAIASSQRYQRNTKHQESQGFLLGRDAPDTEILHGVEGVSLAAVDEQL